MQHIPSQDVPARAAPEQNFRGKVWMEDQVPGVMRVTFTPGARTNWHRHPQGQTLLVLSGSGRVQRRGGPVIAMSAGDVICIDAQEEHWHGAAPGSVMVHIAMQAGETEWLTPVSDEEYGG